MSAILEARNIYKSFPGVLALDDISIKFNKGEVHAIVGENGAGKSTLMKIFGGVYTPDSGEIFIEGRRVNLNSVHISNSEGISVIFQELNLMSELTVSESIFISNLPKTKFLKFIQILNLNKMTRDFLKKLEIDIKPTKLIKNLSVSEKQVVEIVKALSMNANIIIMDEPTAALNDEEVNKLYGIIASLKKEGKTILYVSHRLKEIFDIADRVTVLRDGRFVGTEDIKEIDQETVVKMMVGRNIDKFYKTSQAKQGETILNVKGLTKEKAFNNINFKLKKGQILGIAGLMGCGRQDLLKSIYGLTAYNSGELFLSDKKVEITSPKDAISSGIAFVTEDRKESGIFSEMTVRENTTINIIRRLSVFKGNFINFSKESNIFSQYVKYLNLKYSGDTQLALNLSGGNQQKVILARALMTECDILLLLEPTRGIDVGAKMEVYNLIHDLAKKGIGIILVSSDLPELISLSDDMMVMWQGKATAMLSKDQMDEETIMLCATGNKNLLKEKVRT